MLVDGEGEKKKDSSSTVVLAQQQQLQSQSQSHLLMTGMTPNPLLAFAPPPSSNAITTATAVNVMKQQQQQHYNIKGTDDIDDDDEDIGNGGGSPNNPMDLPMRISIPEQQPSAPSIPLHMHIMGSSAGMVVPNPIMSSSSMLLSGTAIPTTASTTNAIMMPFNAVPSPLASPTLDDPEIARTNSGNHENYSSSWPYSSDAGSVGTSASTIHAMANVVVGGGGGDGAGIGVGGIVGEVVVDERDAVVGDAVMMGVSEGGNQTLDEVEEDEDTDGEDNMDHHYDDEHMHGQRRRRRRRRRANTIHWATSQTTTTTSSAINTDASTTACLPAASAAAAAPGKSVEEEADAAMMQMTNLPPSSYYDDHADIFGEDHVPQSIAQDDQQQQQHYQEDVQQPVRIPSPASPPPSSTMVRSYSFPAVQNIGHQSSGSAGYGTIMSGIHSSSGSLYSEHTMSPTSETESPTGENCWRNNTTTSSSVGVGANNANAVADVTSGGGGNVEAVVKMEPHLVMSNSTAVPRTQVHFHNHSTTSKSGITSAAATTAVPPPAPVSSSSTAVLKAPPPDKRQKRLERNRESARVSRRRRKFYLEELECKVTKLSEEMDIGRMKHACNGLTSVRNARATVLNEVERCMTIYPTYNGVANPLASTMMMMTTKEEEEQVDLANNTHRKVPSLSSSGIHHNVTAVQQATTPNNLLVQPQSTTLHNVDTTPLFTPQLSRTNDELQIVQIFMKQQLTSLVQPTLTKFVLWLSLQNEEYYRGTRSASERLSAARIGERLLHRGTTRATPNSGMMWPLVCHEIGLSYEQEEKVRNVQKMILSNADSWVQRHTALAMKNVMESVHDVISGGHVAAKSREWNVMKILTPEQRVKFLVWARRNRDVIRRLGEAKIRSSGGVVSRTSWMDIGRGGGQEMALECGDDEYMTSPDRHVAANLYIINHFLSKIKQRQQQERTSATPPMFVHPTQLKKLSRRPSFESLAGLQAYEDSQTTKKLSRETSFPSNGSLKRSLNDMTLEGSHSDLHSMNSSCQDAPTNGITPMTAQTAGQAAVLAVLSDVMPIVPKAAWHHPTMVHSAVMSSGIAAGAPMAAGALLPHSHNVLPTVTSQPPSQSSAQPLHSVPHPPKRRHTIVKSPPIPQSVAAASSGGISVHQQHHQHPLPADIPDVDEIPMPTPVSVLLRTSDDYFSLFEPHEPSSATNYATSDQATPYTSSLLSNRHQSAPNFSRWGSSPSHPSLPSAHMAVIPELEPVSVDADPEFSTPEQMNSLSQHVTNNGMLGYSHQSAPQLYNEQPTFLSGSLVNNNALIPQANEVIPTGNDIIEDFAILEGLPMNMEADDWAIGEGFDMDF